MADELPPQRRGWDPLSQSLSNHRKRTHLSSPPISSDPAIFSSSDDDPSAENYTQERRKKKNYRGPWYRQRPASDESLESSQQKKSKRTFERKFDSGVFMGSDGTDVDSSIEEDLVLKHYGKLLPLRQSRLASLREARPASPEDIAKNQIDSCLEEGLETIDLSSRGLTTLSNTTIRPLATFVRVPTNAQEVFFDRLDPQLKLFLASNQLAELPSELFSLERLTVLSLRANQLRELSSGISRLKKLKELNLSQNKLQYLPYEILDLFTDSCRLQSLNLHPNPFYEPRFPQTDEDVQEVQGQYKIGLGVRTRGGQRRRTIRAVSREEERRSWHAQWKTIYQARTEVAFMDLNGMLLKGPNFAEASGQVPVADISDSPEPPRPRGNSISRAPSLFEVALVACSRSPQSSSLISYLPDHTPRYVYEALVQLEMKKGSGGTKCTICHRIFIIPRTSWIEWWSISKVVKGPSAVASAASPLRQRENERDTSESMVPLMRRGCSWFCLPEKAAVEEDWSIAGK